jgi:hypothetical protein
MTENNRIEYKRELTDGLEKEALNRDAIITGVESGVESAMRLRSMRVTVMSNDLKKALQIIAEQPCKKKRKCVLKNIFINSSRAMTQEKALIVME